MDLKNVSKKTGYNFLFKLLNQNKHTIINIGTVKKTIFQIS